MDISIIPTSPTPLNRETTKSSAHTLNTIQHPIWPDGCQTHEYVLAHVPKIITLTYGQIMNHLLSGFVLDMGPEALEKFRTRFESDTRFTNYRLESTPGYERSTVVSLEKEK